MKFNRQFFFNLTLAFLVTSSSLQAIDEEILTKYRVNGAQNIVQYLDKKLTEKQYWKEYLKHQDTTFGYLENTPHLLVCTKGESQLSLYTKKDGNYTLEKNFNAFTGKIEGDKQESGDLKTPVGVYNLTKKLENVDSFYGPMAFVTSYPNLYDKYKKKTGHGIWIHGLPFHQERDKFTKGCIAINNTNLESLSQEITVNDTLLIINEQKLHHVDKTTLANILSQLYEWRYSWIYNNLQAYLDFYDINFMRFDGMNKIKFANYKKRIFAKKETKTILFKNINIIPYPNEDSTFKVTFQEDYKTKSFSFQGEKTLILMLDNNGKIKILTER
jgi:murein L,D-transpeptidase YafK